ncbi:putative ABC transporter, permease protein [Methylococcus capsulatus str. Bath]|uniref:Putative ABC transporter, permease protein n=1 Tax=Methylococcus capsulatus (strain ATCC 33009 / NCIMB 11132 / Bath) TaxID=243233 RepID=Q60CD4_METCA|nr:ABC transporter permease [Methylococcus capsulatus]AAU90565.1 putative ABC transporter, permease protein [Methylococcus capsulatus str. Bath]
MRSMIVQVRHPEKRPRPFRQARRNMLASQSSAETSALPPLSPPEFAVEDGTAVVHGHWNLRGLIAASPDLRERLCRAARRPDLEWDLRGVNVLDSAGAFVLWQAWGERLPERIALRHEQQSAFRRWQTGGIPAVRDGRRPPVPIRRRIIAAIAGLGSHLLAVLALLGQLILDLAHLARHPADIPWREISATIHETGGRALGITALVGFLIGVVVSYLSSLQLKTFGAQVYIVNILGMSIIRELGPLLAAILVAGRSGSSMTARIGVMRVTQELDALAAMGISQSLRLILPKVVALVVALPLLVVWTDVVALAGGAVSAHLELEIGYHQFFQKLPSAVPVANFAIGLGKAAVFGLFVALIACHYGLRIAPNTESLGNETTNSVVVSITLVILVDAVFAILFRSVGIR